MHCLQTNSLYQHSLRPPKQLLHHQGGYDIQHLSLAHGRNEKNGQKKNLASISEPNRRQSVSDDIYALFELPLQLRCGYSTSIQKDCSFNAAIFDGESKYNRNTLALPNLRRDSILILCSTSLDDALSVDELGETYPSTGLPWNMCHISGPQQNTLIADASGSRFSEPTTSDTLKLRKSEGKTTRAQYNRIVGRSLGLDACGGDVCGGDVLLDDLLAAVEAP